MKSEDARSARYAHRSNAEVLSRALSPALRGAAYVAALALLGGCSLVGRAGVHRSGASHSRSEAASSGKGSVASNPRIEANLARILGAEARYSAAALQGSSSPLCPVMAERDAVSVIYWDDDRSVDCFLFTSNDRATKPESYSSIRDFQDHHTMHPAVVSLPQKKAERVFLRVAKNTLFAFEEAEDVRVLAIPCSADAKDLDGAFVAAHFAELCDVSKASFDMLTSDAERAKSAPLADERTKFTEVVVRVAEEEAAAKAKADADALKKVRFPSAVGIDHGAKAVEAAKAHIAAKPKETGIDATAIKKAAVTSSWNVEKTYEGYPIKRTADVTVGFARTDAYAKDPNKKCAFATFEVEEAFDGSKWGPAYATGMATGWTHISCERLK